MTFSELSCRFRTHWKVNNVNRGVEWGRSSANNIQNARKGGPAKNSNCDQSGLELGQEPATQLASGLVIVRNYLYKWQSHPSKVGKELPLCLPARKPDDEDGENIRLRLELKCL
jgi:hypothetical protein